MSRGAGSSKKARIAAMATATSDGKADRLDGFVLVR
jgi:hypothetical protein